MGRGCVVSVDEPLRYASCVGGNDKRTIKSNRLNNIKQIDKMTDTGTDLEKR